jgi:broad specificity phosphatase PhoE
VTTTVFLVRHATHSLVDRVLVGRMSGIYLDRTGERQAERLADLLAARDIRVLQSSPRERARDTAAPIAAQTGVPIEVAEAADEIDLGAWTGQAFEDLASDDGWQRWNNARSTARPPEGESMQEVQVRIVDHLERLHASYPGERVAIVSHAEVIRAAVLHYSGLSLDAFSQIQIPPASISTLLIGGGEGRVTGMPQGVSA